MTNLTTRLNIQSFENAYRKALINTINYPYNGYVVIILNEATGDCLVTDFIGSGTTYQQEENQIELYTVETWSPEPQEGTEAQEVNEVYLTFIEGMKAELAQFFIIK